MVTGGDVAIRSRHKIVLIVREWMRMIVYVISAG